MSLVVRGKQQQPSDCRSADSHREADERFELVFHEHAKAVLGFALRRVERVEDAGDVVADVMLIAWRRRDVMPDGAETRLWLYGVARRVLANRTRADSRRGKLGDRLRSELRQQGNALERAEDDETQSRVRSGLSELSVSDREVLFLNAWEGLDPIEIASVLEIRPAAARTRLHRAKARLQTKLEKSDRGPVAEMRAVPTTRKESR